MSTEQPLRILVVEDNDTFRETVRDLLRDAGYEVRGARNVRKAAKRLNKHTFDLVLTDFNIGEATGAQVIEVANAINPAMKLVVMSGDQALATEAVIAGAARFIAKPFGMHELLGLIAEMLAAPDPSGTPAP